MDNVSGEYEKSSTLELKEALPHNHFFDEDRTHPCSHAMYEIYWQTVYG